jgi:hypothetical protein
MFDVTTQRDRELALWVLPASLDARPERNWQSMAAIDRLARRWLRYNLAISTSLTDEMFEWALERRQILEDRLERVIVKIPLRYFEGEAVDLVLARARQLVDPDKFRIRSVFD